MKVRHGIILYFINFNVVDDNGKTDITAKSVMWLHWIITSKITDVRQFTCWKVFEVFQGVYMYHIFELAKKAAENANFISYISWFKPTIGWPLLLTYLHHGIRRGSPQHWKQLIAQTYRQICIAIWKNLCEHGIRWWSWCHGGSFTQVEMYQINLWCLVLDFCAVGLLWPESIEMGFTVLRQFNFQGEKVCTMAGIL